MLFINHTHFLQATFIIYLYNGVLCVLFFLYNLRGIYLLVFSWESTDSFGFECGMIPILQSSGDRMLNFFFMMIKNTILTGYSMKNIYIKKKIKNYFR